MIISENKEDPGYKISAEQLLSVYMKGYFPMAEPDGEIYFYYPEMRAIFPLRKLKFGKSLRKIIRKDIFTYSFDKHFRKVMYRCAVTRRNDTWISDRMLDAYTELHEAGFAHSVEVYLEGELVGGLYGVTLGGMFCGESMFNLVDNSAKVAFYYLIQQLNKQGFVLLDSQFLNPFTRQLGAIEVPAEVFEQYKAEALKKKCSFT